MSGGFRIVELVLRSNKQSEAGERKVTEEQALEEEAKHEGISKEGKNNMIMRPATLEEIQMQEANERRAEALAKIVKHAQPKRRRTKKPGRDPETGKLCGDVDFAAIEPKASVITPVPGGVGPMTICCLMENTIECFLRRAGR